MNSNLKYKIESGILKAYIDPAFDLDNLNSLSSVIEANKESLSLVDVDLSHCVYMQSHVLGVIVNLKKYCDSLSIAMHLLNVGGSVMQVLHITNLRKMFVIKEDFSFYSDDELFDKLIDGESVDKISDYLAMNYSETIAARLHSIIDSNDPVLSKYAILIMGKAQDISDMDIYYRVLDGDNVEAKCIAIKVLAWLGDMSVKDRMYAFLKSSNQSIANAAAATIALLSDEEDSGKLSPLLNAQDPNIRLATITALALINDEKAFKALALKVRSEEQDSVRIAIAKYIALFNYDEARHILYNLLNDKSIPVREAAASGLAVHGSGDLALEIVEKIKDKDTWFAFFATKSLAGTADINVVHKMQEYYAEVEENVKLAIIETLGKCSLADDDFLIGLLEDANEDIRKEALNSLMLKHSPQATSIALKLYDSDDSWLVRYKAVDIILKSKPEGYKTLLRERLNKETNQHIIEHIITALSA